jgi:uncharacterized protein (DUF169 family)
MKSNSSPIKEKLQKCNEEISYYIRPSTFPLAIKMMTSLDISDQKIIRPKKQLNLNFFLCQAIGIARRQGWSILLQKEDISCPSALFYLGLAKPPSSYWDGKFVFAPFNQTEEARARRSRSFSFFQLNKYKGILISPLFRADFEPDLLLVYGNPAQMMRFVQASVFEKGSALKFSAQGGGSCAFEVVWPILKNQVRLVLPGNGERIFGMAQDDEMVFSIPNKKMDKTIAFLRETHQGGQRFPVPAYGQFTPQLPSDYRRLLKTIRKGK